MTPGRWRQVKQLYQSAAERPADERDAFLTEACAGDDALRGEVERMLRHDTGDGPLDRPAWDGSPLSSGLSAGAQLGPYQIIETIGAGGMGRVYKARDTRLRREVALKLLPPEHLADPEHKQRLMREARAASALNHPGIVTVYEIGSDRGVDYIAMELVEGQSLAQLMKAKRLLITRALDYAIEIAGALAKAHGAGIIHRDLKPANIMITIDGRVKLLDFGLARRLNLAEEETTLLTVEGEIAGTPAYMSPEQAQGKPVDSASDIFAFGSVLYEMLAGRRAFPGETTASTLAAILHEEPAPLRESVPPELERIIGLCLRKDAARRLHNIQDVAIQLQAFKEGSGVARPRPASVAAARPRRWPRAAILASAVVFLAAGVWLGWRFTRSSKAEPALVFTRLTSDSGLTTDPALSPDGKLLAYASDRSGNGNLDIWVQQVGGAAPIRVTEGAGGSQPAFSPDGTRIAFRFEREGGGVYVVPAFGGAPRKIAPLGRRPRFSPDGKWIAYWAGAGGAPLTAGNSKVYVVPSEGGPPRQVAPDLDAATYPVWAPDSKHLLLLGNGKGQIDWWVAAAETDQQATPAVPTGFIEFFRGLTLAPGDWMPQEDSVLFSVPQGQSTNLWRIPMSRQTWKVVGPPQRLTSGTTVDEAPAVGLAAPGKTRVVFASLSEVTNIWSLALDADRGRSAGSPVRLTHESASDMDPSISRDSRKLAFGSNRFGGNQIYVKDLDSGSEMPVTSGPPDKFHPIISPDGSRVVYIVRADPKWLFYLVPAEGGAAEEICSDCGYNTSWSPDGGTIFYVIPASGRIASLDLKSRRTTVVAQHGQFRLYQPHLSPDGRWLAFVAVLAATSRIFVAPFRSGELAPESQWISLTDNPVWDDKPRWSPDGRLLYLLSERDGFRCLWARPFDPGNQRFSGPMFAVYHSHLARQSMLNVGLGSLETGVAPGKFIFNMAERTGNIWIADLPH